MTSVSLLSLAASLSCGGQNGTGKVGLPIIRYNPATYLTDIESAFSNATAGKYVYTDSVQLADVDKEEGYLKYLNVEEERYLYSLDAVIMDLYGSLDKYIATWPEGQRHLFYDDPQGLYTFPVIFSPEMMFKAFITKMYDEKLQNAYPYESDGPAYATWLFRSGRQDSKPGSDGKTMMLDVKADGEWYVYTALDMGWEFTNRIKVTNKGGKILIDDISIQL